MPEAALGLHFCPGMAPASTPGYLGGWFSYALRTCGRAMPNFRNLEFKVLRFIPRRAAAPDGPPITQLASRRIRMMCSRATASRVDASTGSTGPFGALNCPTGTRNSGPLDRITARSITFSSSRTFPGQS